MRRVARRMDVFPVVVVALRRGSRRAAVERGLVRTTCRNTVTHRWRTTSKQRAACMEEHRRNHHSRQKVRSPHVLPACPMGAAGRSPSATRAPAVAGRVEWSQCDKRVARGHERRSQKCTACGVFRKPLRTPTIFYARFRSRFRQAAGFHSWRQSTRHREGALSGGHPHVAPAAEIDFGEVLWPGRSRDV